MPGAPTTVQDVDVVATGRASLHPEHMYGTRKPGLWWVLRSKEWITIPMNVFVIEHDDGLVLFDTGIDPAAATRAYWPDPVTFWFVRRIFRFGMRPDDRLGSTLRRAGYRAEDVTTAVFSHLHFDHVGGIADIPQADLLVAPDAWDALVRSAHPEREYVPRHHILRPGARWQVLDFRPTDDPDLMPFERAADVLGDGSLMVVETPGHIDGSVSMLVRRAGSPPVLLVGDLSYSEELLLDGQVAGTGDAETLLESFAKVQAMKANLPELVIVASHDTTAADKLAAARNAGVEAAQAFLASEPR